MTTHLNFKRTFIPLLYQNYSPWELLLLRFVCLFVCMFACLSVCLSVSLLPVNKQEPNDPNISFKAYLSVCLSVCLYLSIKCQANTTLLSTHRWRQMIQTLVSMLRSSILLWIVTVHSLSTLIMASSQPPACWTTRLMTHIPSLWRYMHLADMFRTLHIQLCSTSPDHVCLNVSVCLCVCYNHMLDHETNVHIPSL